MSAEHGGSYRYGHFTIGQTLFGEWGAWFDRRGMVRYIGKDSADVEKWCDSQEVVVIDKSDLEPPRKRWDR